MSPLMRALTLSWCLAVPAGAAEYRSEVEGWQVKVPAGWKHAEQGGRLLLGSDTEAGLMAVWFLPGATYEAVVEEGKKGLVEDGVELAPLAAPQPFAVRGAKAAAVELSGAGGDGTPLRAFAVGVVGPRGALAVVGLTTAEKYAGLRKRTEELARSVVFRAPKAGDVASLRGTICAYSGGSGYSHSSKMVFDGQGRVSYGSEFVASGSFKDSAGNYAGGWGTATGNQNEARDVGSYAVQGNRVSIRWPDGNAQECAVHFRQQDGRITELKCGEKLWGAGLCE